MTPGQEALAEAARLESARVYSRTVPEHRNTPATACEPAAPVATDLDAARVRAARAEAKKVKRIEQAIAGGATTRQIMDAYGVDYGTVKTILDRMRAA